MTYIFYYTETTGKLTAFDQILQFAAIKTEWRAASPRDMFHIPAASQAEICRDGRA